MHCPGSRPRASSRVLLIAAMDSPAIAWASSAVNSVQASSGSATGAFESAALEESAEPPQPAARAAASRNDGIRSRRLGDLVTGWIPPWFFQGGILSSNAGSYWISIRRPCRCSWVGSGTVISRTPSLKLALAWSGSVPSGSGMVRKKRP
jgi:hypothetical protein